MKKIMKKDFMKNINQYLIPAAIVVAGLLIAAGLFQVGSKKVPGQISAEEAAERAMNFINDVALAGQSTANLLETTDESGLYKIKIEIDGQEYESFVSKDGKFLFPQGTEIAESEESQPEASAGPGIEVADREKHASDKPKAELFVMSYCPYGNQAEELMAPVDELLGDKADIELHYVIYSNYGGGGPDYCLDKEAKYCSMHGIQELNQGVRELCVQKYQRDKLWDFVKAANTGCDYQNVDSCWEGVAKKVGVNVQQVKTCENNEALTLLANELELNKKYGVAGSPQLVINGVEYQGARSAESYKDGVCFMFNSVPEECNTELENTGGAATAGECD